MIEQLKTIQENAERIAHNSTDDPRSCGYAILTALAQLEAMVGEQVHQFRKKRCSDWYDGKADHSDGGGPYEERTLFRFDQLAQQPQAEAVLAEADRRAGAAERELASCRDDLTRLNRVRDQMKTQWGVDRYTSFDVVWAEALKLKQQAEAVPSDLCERICSAIKDADDKSMGEADYMLDSNDCIRIVREQFAAMKQGGGV